MNSVIDIRCSRAPHAVYCPSRSSRSKDRESSGMADSARHFFHKPDVGKKGDLRAVSLMTEVIPIYQLQL